MISYIKSVLALLSLVSSVRESRVRQMAFAADVRTYAKEANSLPDVPVKVYCSTLAYAL